MLHEKVDLSEYTLKEQQQYILVYARELANDGIPRCTSQRCAAHFLYEGYEEFDDREQKCAEIIESIYTIPAL